MLKRCIIMAAAAAMMGPMAFAQNQSTPPGGMGQSNQQPNTAMQPNRMDSQSPDAQQMTQEFFKEATFGNNLEIRYAQLAQQRSQNAQIKQAAQQLMTDHQEANQLIKQIAQKQNIQMSMPADGLNPVGQAMVDAIQKKQGEMFDHHWVFDMVGDHAKDVLMMRLHAQQGQAPAVREYASQVLPKIEAHLKMLEHIAGPMVGETASANPMDQAQPASGHMEGQSAPAQGNPTGRVNGTNGMNSGANSSGDANSTGGSNNGSSNPNSNTATPNSGSNAANQGSGTPQR